MQAQRRAGLARESRNVNTGRLDVNSMGRRDVDESSSMPLYISRLNHLHAFPVGDRGAAGIHHHIVNFIRRPLQVLSGAVQNSYKKLIKR